jgi:hypothetical protein
MTLRDILERGYFPKELPPPFVTSSFAHIVTSVSTLPQDFQSNIEVPRPQIPIAKASKYSLARGGLLRRRLSIPNPVLYYLLCREIYLHWNTLRGNIGGTSLSSTSPEFKLKGRAIDGLHPQSARSLLAIQTRLNKRYILRTDISRFYHSIYTHAIPWALLTKPIAKTNRGMGELGNRIDYLVRQGQDRQTVGIPIGPDTSLVIAEAIMQACDRELLAEMPQLKGYRFIDDYELSFRHRKEAEDAFHILEKILSEYELALNPKKTGIAELPCYLEAPWVGSLRTFPIRIGKGQEGDLINYFDLAFGLQKSHPDDPVLQYAVGRLKPLSINTGNWQLFQRLLLNCAVPEPATFNHVLEALIIRVNAGAHPEIPQIEEAINSIICDHSFLGHSSEVAWALLACLALRIPISSGACAALSRCDDSVVALLALHCEAEKLCASPLDKSIWLNYMNQESLYEDHWLLSYEANLKGWLPSQEGIDHVANDPNFGFLKAAGVTFYDMTKVRPTAIAPIPAPRPPTPQPAPGGY